jgi:hypothetical protein
MTHAEIIEVLGGPLLVARALGCHHAQPVRWKVAGIPAKRWVGIVAAARDAGRADITLDMLAATAAQAA